MYKLDDIKLKSLRDYLSDYNHFTSLTKEAQQEYLKKIMEMDDPKQEEVLTWLRYQDEIEKGKILAIFKAQVGLLDGKIKMMTSKKEEQSAELGDKAQEENLLNSLN